MKKLWIICALALSACVTVSSPRPPAQPGPVPAAFTERTLALRIQTASHPIADCDVTLTMALSGDFRGQSDAAGYLAWVVRIPNPDPGGGLNARVAIACPGFVPLADSFVIAPTGNQDITFGGEAGGNQPMLRPGPTPVAPPAPTFSGPVRFEPGRVAISGRTSKFEQLSCFSVAWQLATGDEAGAIAKLDEAAHIDDAAGLRFRSCRVFTTAVLMFDLAPEAGRAVLPHLFELARARDLHIEVVANADTALRAYDVDAHSRETARACAASDVCALWLYANEPFHGTQSDRFHDMAQVQTDAARFAGDAGLGGRWSAGAPEDDEATSPAGAVAARHLTRDLGKMVRHQRDLAALADTLGVRVLSDEPMGCDEPGGTHGQRYYDPAIAEQLGAVAAGFGLPWTFHMQSGLSSALMGPTQRACAAAMLRGAHLIPDDIYPHFENAGGTYIGGNHGWANSPVQQADLEDHNPTTDRDEPGCGQRVFSFTWGDQGVAMAIGVTCDLRIRWGNGWSPTEQIPTLSPTFQVWKIRRGSPAAEPETFVIPKAA